MSGPFTFFGLSVKQAWTSQRVGGQTRHKQVPCVAHHDDGDKDDEEDDYNEDNDNEDKDEDEDEPRRDTNRCRVAPSRHSLPLARPLSHAGQ